MATVCQTCGDRGFEEALLYCESCKIEAVHHYCMGVTPVPFTRYITWLCEDCLGSDCDSNSIELDQTAKRRLILKTSDKNKEKEEEEQEEEQEQEHEPHIPNSIELD